MTGLPSGTVYGTLLNFQSEWARWAPRMNDAPYKAAPTAPVLYIKTANTFTPNGGAIVLPAGAVVEVTPSLGLVMGAGGQLAGCLLLNDVAIAHDSYYRPPIRFRCVDGFLGVGPEVVPVDDIAALMLTLSINGAPAQTLKLSETVRNARTLLNEVNAFMTLREGDVLMLGTDCLADGTRPRVKKGDRVDVSAPGFSTLCNTFVGEAA
jgi:5-oxopent-3-ene-1,2,5-tricarboxylate decarboxylase / 2-hydroxyhepta-2,4-diene-1,7-dioate isomerase